MAATLLALGLDPDRCTLFVQSHRPEVTELAWLLATVTPVSWLERTPTYKEKKQNQPDDVNHGLLTYPVLQAADIVIYKASLVPVGKDQAAHLELSREIVRALQRALRRHVPGAAGGLHRGAHRPRHRRRPQDEQVGRQHDRRPRRARRHPRARSCRWSPTRSGSCAPIRAVPRSATSASCTASSAPTARRSRTASGRPGPAASTRSGCWPTGSSPTTLPARERYEELMAAPGLVDEILAAGAGAHAPDGRGDDGRGPRQDGASLTADARRPARGPRSAPGQRHPRAARGRACSSSSSARSARRSSTSATSC